MSSTPGHASHLSDPVGTFSPDCEDCRTAVNPATGRLGSVARKWGKERRDVDSEAAVLVELAIDAADMADRARDSTDDRLYLAAATRLQQLMRAAVHDDRNSGTDSDWTTEVARILGSGPGMGNTPKS